MVNFEPTLIFKSSYRKKDKTPRNTVFAIIVGAIIIIVVVALLLFLFDPAMRVREKEFASFLESEFEKDAQYLESKLLKEMDFVKETVQRDVEIVEKELKVLTSSFTEKAPLLSEYVQADTELPPHLSILDTIRLLFEMGISSPPELLTELKTDPFSTLGGPSSFTCPSVSDQQIIFSPTSGQQIFSYNQNSAAFRAGERGSFIFYQHLRKAGGTGFCDLAVSNLPRNQVPSYYCMPDNKGSLATPPWNNQTYLVNAMTQRNFRIASNEWDAFYRSFLSISGAVFATTFRDPIDRWYSQYRFEHLERRDGSTTQPRQSFIQYYNSLKPWTMGSNYYIKTFVGYEDLTLPQNKGDFYWTYHKFQNKAITWDMFESAMDILLKFDLVLIMDWLETSASLNSIERVFGWKTPPKQVLPHELQAVRASHMSAKARDVIPSADFNAIINENALDVLFFEIAKRIFLERAVCHDTS